jgi:ABC-2 type transport system permease protein
MSVLIYLLRKEVKQFAANPFLPRLVLLFPLAVMLILPWIATMDIHDVNLTVVDHDGSALSQRLVHQVSASSYFHLQKTETTYASALRQVEHGSSDLLMEIPQGFERNLLAGTPVQVYVAANAVNSNKGSLGSSYLGTILAQFAPQVLQERGITVPAPTHLSVQYLYNPRQNYRYYMVPALMIVVLIALCGFLPTLNIVSEKENGTIDQINVTPVSKTAFIASKILFYGVLGIVIFSIAFLIGKAFYGIAPYGNVWVIYLGALLFLLFMSAMGLTISNFSNTLQQAILTMFAVMMVFMLLSGIFTPVSSMQPWAQAITYLLPPRYFVEIMRGVCMKGSNIADLWLNFMMLSLLMVAMSIVAILTYRKQK